MPRFGLDLDEDLGREFRRLFFDHGLRTAVLRKCVRRLVKLAREQEVSRSDIEKIADSAFESVKDDNLL